jgi:ABC-type uncharacterized transport system involved in gliding motility auxiliary subunit
MADRGAAAASAERESPPSDVLVDGTTPTNGQPESGAPVAPPRPRRRRRAPSAGAARPRQEVTAADFADGSPFYRFSAFLGVAAAILLAAAMVVFNTTGAFTKEVLALLIVGMVLGVLYAVPRMDEIGAWLRTRTARQGSNATLLSVAFIGLLVVGNWFANRHSQQWDLTAARRYTLADQTVKILERLDRDVKVTAFFPSRQEDAFTRGTKDLLRQYERRSDRISLEFIDPDVNPGAARQYEIESYPVTIFEAGDRKEETTGVTEQDFTSALLKLTRVEQKKVYFLQGHQERDPDSAQPTGYNSASQALKRENYVVEKLSLLTTQRVPEDAAVLVIAGPKVPLLQPEQTAIREYVDRGGHVLLLAEPRQDAGLGDLLETWHVDIGNDVVVDPGRNYIGDPLTPAPIPQQGHRISTSLPDVLMPGTRSVSIIPGAGSEYAIVPLLKTTDRAWGETTLEGNVPARPDPGEDTQGPVTVAVAVNKTDPVSAISPGSVPAPTPTATPGSPAPPKGRMVVVGNAEFAANTYFSQVLGNRDFFINSVNWLAEDEDLISIRAEPPNDPPVVLTNQSQALVFYTTVVFVPLSVLLLGAVIWWQRR